MAERLRCAPRLALAGGELPQALLVERLGLGPRIAFEGDRRLDGGTPARAGVHGRAEASWARGSGGRLAAATSGPVGCSCTAARLSTSCVLRGIHPPARAASSSPRPPGSPVRRRSGGVRAPTHVHAHADADVDAVLPLGVARREGCGVRCIGGAHVVARTGLVLLRVLHRDYFTSPRAAARSLGGFNVVGWRLP